MEGGKSTRKHRGRGEQDFYVPKLAHHLRRKGWRTRFEVPCYDPSSSTKIGYVDMVADQNRKYPGVILWIEWFTPFCYNGIWRVDLRCVEACLRRAELAREHPREAGVPSRLVLVARNRSDVPILERGYLRVLRHRGAQGLGYPEIEVEVESYRELAFNPRKWG